MKNISKKLPVFFLTVLLFFAALLAPVGGGKVSAATDLADPPSSIDETNVLDDLEGSTLNGKVFNKDDFTQSDIRDPQIISLVEYGYSFYANRQDDYALYVYIYNPRVQVFDNNSARNQIQIRAGDLGADDYRLELLNYSTEIGYEGLFAKFKVTLTETEKQLILGALGRAERVYKVTEFELAVQGEIQNYPCATTYTFQGYAQGYGSPFAADESTLTCAVDGFEEYVELDVHQTVYRPHGQFAIEEDGGGTKGQLLDGNQPQLNSCYFRVPEKYFTQYGDLTKTVCQWYEYQTQPMFVTTDRNIYNKLHALYGAPFSTFDPEHNQGLLLMSWGNEYFTNLSPEDGYQPTWHKTPFLWGSNLGTFWPDSYSSEHYFNNSYVFQADLLGNFVYWPGNDLSYDAWIDQRFTNLAGVFLANAPYYNAEISDERIQSELLLNSEHLGGTMLAGRYSEKLFSENIDPGRTRGYNKQEIELKKNDTMIWSDALEKKGFWGIGNEFVTDEQSINVQRGITITEKDLTGTDYEIAQNLCIAEEDVADLKNEFAKTQKAMGGERLILLRYAITNYHSAKAIAKTADVSEYGESAKDNQLMISWAEEYVNDRINGYLAQETVFLDFDIISLWFATEDAETEIPVMMTPMDVISGLQPGVGEEPATIDSSGMPWWGWLVLALVLVVLLAVLALLFPVLKPIFKAIFYVITAPFRLIALGIKKISKASKRRKKEKAAAPPKPKGTTTQAKKPKVITESPKMPQKTPGKIQTISAKAGSKKPTAIKSPAANRSSQKTISKK